MGTEEGREAAGGCGQRAVAAAGARRDLSQNPSQLGSAEQMEGHQLPAAPPGTALRQRVAPGCRQAQELLTRRGEERGLSPAKVLLPTAASPDGCEMSPERARRSRGSSPLVGAVPISILGGCRPGTSLATRSCLSSRGDGKEGRKKCCLVGWSRPPCDLGDRALLGATLVPLRRMWPWRKPPRAASALWEGLGRAPASRLSRNSGYKHLRAQRGDPQTGSAPTVKAHFPAPSRPERCDIHLGKANLENAPFGKASLR